MLVKRIALTVVTLFLSCSNNWAQESSPAVTAQAGRTQEGTAHNREFWRAIVKNRYAVPDGQPIFPLLRELSGHLGSPDPELRDDLAYTIIAVWFKHQKFSSDELNTFLDEWETNLRASVGEPGGDSVLKRSFSALCLASLAERDLKEPFLSEERYRRLVADALAYLKDERDLRGFDPTIGWIHATAHTADLLTALASNRLFRREDQGRVLDAVSGRISSAHEIFSFGEQDRLAMVAATIAQRTDLDSKSFDSWLSALDANDQQVWKDTPPKLDLLQTFENDTYMLRALAVYLSNSAAASTSGGGQSSMQNNLRDEVMQLLRKR
jgi:Protein of unknown function (DUF2785)